jgi:small-conductance mechanosensitive channel
LAIGFGAQNLVRDVISGFFMLLEDQVRVGDTVKVGDKSGRVEGIGLRILTLRDFDGSVHTIPNGTITTVTNMTKDYAYSVLRVTVSASEDVDAVTNLLQELGTDLRREPAFTSSILADLEVIGVDELTGSYVTITARCKTVPGAQWRITRELRARIKKAFETHKIEHV